MRFSRAGLLLLFCKKIRGPVFPGNTRTTEAMQLPFLAILFHFFS